LVLAGVDVVAKKNRLAGTLETSGIVDDWGAVPLGSRWGRLLAEYSARRKSE
jgi:hypothetical protein